LRNYIKGVIADGGKAANNALTLRFFSVKLVFREAESRKLNKTVLVD